MNAPTEHDPAGFEAVFRRYRLRRRLAAAWCNGTRAAAWALGLLALYALLDYMLTWPDELRVIAAWTWKTLAALLALGGMVRGLLLSSRSIAREWDARRGDVRRSATTAWELDRASECGETPLGEWLCRRQNAESARLLTSWMRTHSPNGRLFARGAALPAALAVLLSAFWLICPEAASTLFRRTLLPELDTPPLSPYSFRVTPDPADVSFGGDLLLTADVSGGKPPGALRLLVRSEAIGEQNLAAFREGERTWGRRLEYVTRPCSIAFATEDGRARSRWHAVSVNYRPRITGGGVTLVPPPYTGREPESRALSGRELTVPEGGAAVFELQCNVPVAEIVGTWQPERPGAAPQTIRGEVDREKASCRLALTVHGSGNLSIDVKDARGLAMEKPLDTIIRAKPDQPPAVALIQPSQDCLVVAGHPLEMIAEASDEYGLERFELFRNLRGTTPRPVSLLPTPSVLRHQAKCTIDLAEIGAQPGDVFEWRVEAKDANPARLNITSSPTVTVAVISPEEYAELLRMEMTLEEFAARYEELSQALEASMRVLDEAARADDPEQRKAALDEARRAHAEARSLAETLARDFPVFDSDKELSRLAKIVEKRLKANLEDMENLDPGIDSAPWQTRLAAMKERLDGPRQDLACQQEDAAEIARIAAIMQVFYELEELAGQQKEMRNQFERSLYEMRRGRRVTTEQLEALGHDQATLLDAVLAWESRLPAVIRGVPPEAELFRKTLLALQSGFRARDIPELMEAAVDESARLHRAVEAFGYAEQAHAAMRQLLDAFTLSIGDASPADCLGGNCRATALQMMAAMDARCRGKNPLASGFGNGVGSGIGGHGFRMLNGASRSLIGPARSRRAGSGAASSSRSSRGGAGHADRDRTRGTERGDTPSHSQGTPSSGGSSRWESVPPAYRDAVKKFFEQNR